MTRQDDYPRPALSVDLVVLRPGERGDELLLICRGRPPFEGHWALPGGFLDIDETLEDAALRELVEETAVRLQPAQLRQIGAFSKVDRDPRGRVISVAFLARVPADTQASAGDDAGDVAWHRLDAMPDLAFDHSQIVDVALRQARRDSPD